MNIWSELYSKIEKIILKNSSQLDAKKIYGQSFTPILKNIFFLKKKTLFTA
jgi:hypothetical protein